MEAQRRIVTPGQICVRIYTLRVASEKPHPRTQADLPDAIDSVIRRLLSGLLWIMCLWLCASGETCPNS